MFYCFIFSTFLFLSVVLWDLIKYLVHYKHNLLQLSLLCSVQMKLNTVIGAVAKIGFNLRYEETIRLYYY